jgi:hypothetical protein
MISIRKVQKGSEQLTASGDDGHTASLHDCTIKLASIHISVWIQRLHFIATAVEESSLSKDGAVEVVAKSARGSKSQCAADGLAGATSKQRNVV